MKYFLLMEWEGHFYDCYIIIASYTPDLGGIVELSRREFLQFCKDSSLDWRRVRKNGIKTSPMYSISRLSYGIDRGDCHHVWLDDDYASSAGVTKEVFKRVYPTF